MRTRSSSRGARRATARARAVVMCAAMVSVVVAPFAALATRARRDESGQESIIGPVAMGLLAILAAVAIWAVLRQLGLDIVEEMRSALGL